jgi:uncharacterized protein (DUF488 family)
MKIPKNMYYRRKVAMAILEMAGGNLGKTDLQKMVFLFSKMQEKPAYDFFPYKYGCFSLQLDQDLLTLQKYGYLEINEDGWHLQKKNIFISSLNTSDQIQISTYEKLYGNLKGMDLIQYVYQNYPYYAIHSEIAKTILNPQEWEKVQSIQTKEPQNALYTIGYEGKSAETFTNQLIQNNVRVLCDIRKNPISMKFGFSKNKLKWIVEAAGIQYIHLPGLGIDSVKRQNLSSSDDYQKLFQEYKKTVLLHNLNDQATILNLLNDKKSVALTCFEADHNCCHRSHTANAILKKSKGRFWNLFHI